MPHQWNPKQYAKFAQERELPHLDLFSLIHPVANPRILDLGCGNGKLTRHLHDRLRASFTLGIDQSKEMIEQALLQQKNQVVFKLQNIETFSSAEPFDLIVSNAAFQWIPNHLQLLNQLCQLLKPAGQLVIQIPANYDYPTHLIAYELQEEEPFKSALQGHKLINPILKMEEYAEHLDDLGFESQSIRLQLYVHFLESTASIIEWVKGSLLTYFKSYLHESLYEEFLAVYQERLFSRLKWSEPFLFPMKRLFIWGQLPTDLPK